MKMQWVKMWSAAVVYACGIAACGGASQIGLADTGGTPSGNGGTTSINTGGSDATGGASSGGGTVSQDPLLSQAPPDTVAITTVGTCGGTTCKEDETCCLQTSTCFGVDHPEDCKVDADAASASVARIVAEEQASLCASNADCESDEYCENSQTCQGVGYCQSRTNCGTSSAHEFCGCNGVTYPNHQSACFAGVRIAGDGSCGVPHDIGSAGGFAPFIVTNCGSDADCGSGQQCCAINAECYDSDTPELCAYPPEGSTRVCIDESQCFADDDFCAGEGCDSPGGCVSQASIECTGLFAPVCGCDGQTYTNADCATASGIRVAHTGECPAAAVAVDG